MRPSFFILLSILIGLSNCSEKHNSTRLNSKNYQSKKERIEILNKEIKAYSTFTNAEFELFNVNGFSNSRVTIPGASSWDYQFVVKVKTDDIDKWTEGMVKDIPKLHKGEWMENIIEQRKNEWPIHSTPEFYIRKGENVVVIVYRPEGIIFKRVIQN